MQEYYKHDILLKNIKENLPDIKKLLCEVNGHWGCEDGVYRFYHYSFKVYFIQDYTKAIVKLLSKISPNKNKNKFCNLFEEIIKDGIGKKWELKHNEEWSKNTRPILEAFFHARYFLEMAENYGDILEKAPELLPSGWASLLSLYNLR